MSVELTELEEQYRLQHAKELQEKSEALKTKCTVCRKGFSPKDILVHPRLGVPICKSCKEFHESGELSVDEDGDQKYCTWCGNGGNLNFCGKCQVAAFCGVCIKSNLGDDEFKEVKNAEDWNCYLCNSEPLWELRGICLAIAKKNKERKKKSIAPNLQRLKKMQNESDRDSGSGSSDSDEPTAPSPIKPRVKSFVADDLEDPHARPPSTDGEGEESEQNLDFEEGRRWRWARKGKKRARTSQARSSSEESESNERKRKGKKKAETESEEDKRESKVKKKKRSKKKTEESESESSDEDSRKKKKSRSRTRFSKSRVVNGRCRRHSNDDDIDDSPTNARDPSEESDDQGGRGGSKSKKKDKSRKKFSKSRVANGRRRRHRNDDDTDDPTSNPRTSPEESDDQRGEGDSGIKNKNKSRATSLSRVVNGRRRRHRNDDSDDSLSKPHEPPDLKKKKDEAGEKKSKKKSLQPKPSTSFALDSDDAEDFTSSSAESDFCINWLHESIKDFEKFNGKAAAQLKLRKEEANDLTKKSTIDEIRAICSLYYRNMGRVVKKVTKLKEEFRHDFEGWQNEMIRLGKTQANEADHEEGNNPERDEEAQEEITEEVEKEPEELNFNRSVSSPEPPKKTPRPKDSDKKRPKKARNEECRAEATLPINEEDHDSDKDKKKSQKTKTPKTSATKSTPRSEEVQDSDRENRRPHNGDSDHGRKTSNKKKVVQEDSANEQYFDTATLHLDMTPSVDSPKSSLEKRVPPLRIKIPETPTEPDAAEDSDESPMVDEAGGESDGALNPDDAEALEELLQTSDIEMPEEPSVVNETIIESDIEMAADNEPETSSSTKSRKESLSEKSDNKTKREIGKHSKNSNTSSRPGPASKTGKSPQKKSTASLRTSISAKDSPEVSNSGTQSTHFSEEEDGYNLNEDLALQELLKDSDSDAEEEVVAESNGSKTTRRKKKKKKEEEEIVVSNMAEFANIPQLHKGCYVDLTGDTLAEGFSELTTYKVRRSKTRGSDTEIENLCNLDGLEEPSRKERKTKKLKKRAKKAKISISSGESDSDDEGDGGVQSDGSEKGELRVKAKISQFKPIDEEEEAARQLMISSDDDEDDKQDPDKKKKQVKEVKLAKKVRALSTDDSNDSKSAWRKDKLLNQRLDITSSSDEESKAKKKKRKAILESDESDEDKKSIKSDHGNSSDDFVKTKKKAKKRRKSTSSEASVSSESESEETDDELFADTKKNKKRKRVFLKNSSSDSDECKVVEAKKSDSSPKKKRKIMRNSELQSATQDAARQEKERILRHQEMQKVYNKIIEERSLEASVDELVLEFDPKTKEPLVEVHKDIATKLKKHQVQGIKFMWNAVFESIERCNITDGTGCILAHCMGLGKTLQIVSVIHTVLSHEKINLSTVLIVTPLSTVENWKNEFAMWTKNIHDVPELEIYDLTNKKRNDERKYCLKSWNKNGGVMIISYDLYRNLANPATKSKAKDFLAAKKIFQSTLTDPGPDIIICDEGHVLKNEDKKLSMVMTQIRTKRRIVLTGTPLQNNLIEYHCMMQFVKPNFLGNRKEFTNRFVNPIKEGQHKESTQMQVKIMTKRACVLHKMLEPSVQRFDYSVLMPHLQEKFEYVIKVRLSEVQIRLYSKYLGICGERTEVRTGACLFSDYQNLLRVWNHPYGLLLRALEEEDDEEADSAGSLKDFICDDSGSESATGSGSDSESRSSNEAVSKRVTRQGKENGEVLEQGSGTGFINSWWRKTVTNEEVELLAAGNKLVLLFSILKECDKIGDKMLVFSQSLYALNLIEYFLGRASEASEEEREELFCGIPGNWTNGISYFRLDGSTNVNLRFNYIKKFNDPKNIKAKLFLVSTRAGGLGVNMVGANRVVLFDASWNPSNDMQSIFRVYRFGQKKPCYIYRFLAAGTMEEKIYDRQVTKLALSGRVVDKHTIDRHYTQADLEELYSFEPYRENEKTMVFPKDRLLAELYQQHKAIVEEYFEHDSLLEDRPEEKLSEEEQKAAWEEFENEKDLEVQRRLAQAEYERQRLLQAQQMQAIRQSQDALNNQLMAAMMQNHNQPNIMSGMSNMNTAQYAQLLNALAQSRAPTVNPMQMQAQRDNRQLNSQIQNGSNLIDQLLRRGNLSINNAQPAQNFPVNTARPAQAFPVSRVPAAADPLAINPASPQAVITLPDDDDENPTPSGSAGPSTGPPLLKVRNDLFQRKED